MASKDGIMSFGFAGTYTDVVVESYIMNQLDDGRMLKARYLLRKIIQFNIEDKTNCKTFFRK